MGHLLPNESWKDTPETIVKHLEDPTFFANTSRFIGINNQSEFTLSPQIKKEMAKKVLEVVVDTYQFTQKDHPLVAKKYLWKFLTTFKEVFENVFKNHKDDEDWKKFNDLFKTDDLKVLLNSFEILHKKSSQNSTKWLLDNQLAVDQVMEHIMGKTWYNDVVRISLYKSPNEKKPKANAAKKKTVIAIDYDAVQRAYGFKSHIFRLLDYVSEQQNWGLREILLDLMMTEIPKDLDNQKLMRLLEGNIIQPGKPNWTPKSQEIMKKAIKIYIQKQNPEHQGLLAELENNYKEETELLDIWRPLLENDPQKGQAAQQIFALQRARISLRSQIPEGAGFRFMTRFNLWAPEYALNPYNINLPQPQDPRETQPIHFDPSKEKWAFNAEAIQERTCDATPEQLAVYDEILNFIQKTKNENPTFISPAEFESAQTVVLGYRKLHENNSDICREILERPEPYLFSDVFYVRKPRDILIHAELGELPMDARALNFFATLQLAWNAVRESGDRWDEIDFVKNGLNKAGIPCFEARSRAIGEWMDRNMGFRKVENIAARTVLENMNTCATIFQQHYEGLQAQENKTSPLAWNALMNHQNAFIERLLQMIPVQQRQEGQNLHNRFKNQQQGLLSQARIGDHDNCQTYLRVHLMQTLVGKRASDKWAITMQDVNAYLALME
jgi:hypothetical protein